MTKFRTTLPEIAYPFTINHQNTTLCIGSCFAENIGTRLSSYQFPSLINPFGILYNPISIADHLHGVLDNTSYLIDELFQHQGLWHHFRFHSRFSGVDSQQVIEKINEQTTMTKSFIEKANLLIITLGTARVFEEQTNGQVVANCHKLPDSHFNRKLLSNTECVDAFASAFKKLKLQHPKINIMLTVSPIRHIRDGLIESQRSKATLLLAVSELEKQFSNVHYFPAWELMMDDLRDYRFYDTDMIHPSETAIQYIWDYFSKIMFSKETKMLLPKIVQVVQAAHHRPFQVKSKEHQDFLQKQLERIEELCKEHPFLTFKTERGLLEGQLV